MPKRLCIYRYQVPTKKVVGKVIYVFTKGIKLAPCVRLNKTVSRIPTAILKATADIIDSSEIVNNFLLLIIGANVCISLNLDACCNEKEKKRINT